MLTQFLYSIICFIILIIMKYMGGSILEVKIYKRDGYVITSTTIYYFSHRALRILRSVKTFVRSMTFSCRERGKSLLHEKSGK